MRVKGIPENASACRTDARTLGKIRALYMHNNRTRAVKDILNRSGLVEGDNNVAIEVPESVRSRVAFLSPATLKFPILLARARKRRLSYRVV